MPWKETCRMDEKLFFVADCLRGELPMTALCEDYGISRKTDYSLETVNHGRGDYVSGKSHVNGLWDFFTLA